jgi:hypothetical protein
MYQSLVPFDDGPGWRINRQLARARREQLFTDLAVFRHGLDAQRKAEEDRQDSQALGDAMRAALDEELRLLHEGLAQAGQLAGGIELAARKVETTANINNRRAVRRFGGE